MAANGAPSLIKNEEGGSDYPNHTKGISIANRRAAKRGFNAGNINASLSPQVRSPYVTIPPGISPSALLDSPLLVPNAQAQLSPTTGTFHQFSLSTNPESLKLKLKLANEDDDDDEENTIKALDSSSKPEPHLESDDFAVGNLAFDEYFEYPRDFQETSKNVCFEDKTERCSSLQQSSNNNTSNQMSREIRNTDINMNSKYQETKHHIHQKGAYIPKEVARRSQDGYYWRKYGQKHVKGSEFPRSYYRCTNANCLVKKKVERSHAGEITRIVYSAGSHNHPEPHPSNKRVNDMSSSEMASNDQGGGGGTSFKAEGTNDVVFGSDRNWIPGHGCMDGTFTSASLLSEFPNNNNNNNNPLSSVSNFDRTHVETTTRDFSANTVGSQDGEDQNQASPVSISYKDEDDEYNADCEPKKRKRENFPSNETTIPRSGHESKVVVQIESDVDILDDGYRWRKYGQKVVKGNPNPRSYYKCTTPGCPVRKHVERAANDIKSVLTTYEGKHNHVVPTSKTGSLAISHAANQLRQAVANSSLKPDHVSKAGKRAKDMSNLPLYMERKPILNYNDLMKSNLAGNICCGHHHHDLSFGVPSSLYPYSFPPFPSLAYSSLSMNSNNSHMKTYTSSSKFNHPMLLPDYMSMSLSQMSQHHVPAGHAATHVPSMTLQNSSRGQHEQIRECRTGNMMKPKEEQTEDEVELFDTHRLSVPNHGNGIP